MSAGFGAEKMKNGKASVIIDDKELDKLLKKYKKIKKYMKSSLYQVKVIEGSESIVSDLMKYSSDEDL
jgi:hypothetical protein